MSDGLIVVQMPRVGPVFGLVVRNGRVGRAAPVAKYTVGWDEARAKRYFTGRGCDVVFVPDDPRDDEQGDEQ